jgi:predicted RNA binding protein with dsRBD fold (UPF0201 family)
MGSRPRGEPLARSAEDEEAMDLAEVSNAPSTIADMTLEVAAPLHPTEDEGAVRMSIKNLFPTLDLLDRDGEVTGRGEGPGTMARLRRRLREMRIRDTSRRVLGSGVSDGSVTFSLNKQSAYARVPNFSTGGAPLGDITVTVRVADTEALVNWLCELDEE